MNCLGRPILLPVPPARTSAIADPRPSISDCPPAAKPPPLGDLAWGLQAALTFETALDGAGAGLADPLYLVELLLRRAKDLFQRAELPDKPLGDPARQAWHTLELTVSTGLDEQLFQLASRAVAEGMGDLGPVRELLG